MASAQNGINPNALSRRELASLLNGSRTVALRRQTGLSPAKAKCTTQNTVSKWLESGLPANQDGKISLVEVAAWLACERKDGGSGRPSAANKAARGGKSSKRSTVETLAERMREFVEAGDIVSLIGLLMDHTADLPTAEAVSKIVVNVINAEKGRVKAQADEYERKLAAGELLRRADVEQGYAERAAFIRETLENLPSFAPRLQAKNLIELRGELAEIAREVLLSIAGEAAADA